MLADGDLVVTWLHVAFTSPNGPGRGHGGGADLAAGRRKVASVDTLLDTAAVGAAFA